MLGFSFATNAGMLSSSRLLDATADTERAPTKRKNRESGVLSLRSGQARRRTPKSGFLGLAAQESRDIEIVGRHIVVNVADVLLHLMNHVGRIAATGAGRSGCG